MSRKDIRMTYDLDAIAEQIAKQITNTLNSDQNYKPVKFEHALLFVRGTGNIKPPQDDDIDGFIKRIINAIPRVPKTMTLDYLTAQLRERASQGAKGMFSMVSLYPFVVSDLNRVIFTLNADRICEKLKTYEYRSASRPTFFNQYSLDDLGEILDILFKQGIIEQHPIDSYDMV